MRSHHVSDLLLCKLCYADTPRSKLSPQQHTVCQERYLIPLDVEEVVKMKGKVSVFLLFHHEFILNTKFMDLPVREFF